MLTNLMTTALSSPGTGDDRDLTLPIIIGIVAVILIVISIVLGAKSKKK